MRPTSAWGRVTHAAGAVTAVFHPPLPLPLDPPTGFPRRVATFLAIWVAPARGRGPGWSAQRRAAGWGRARQGAGPPEEGVALPPGRSGSAGARSSWASKRTSARPLRTRPLPARVAGAAAFSLPRLASRDWCEPPLTCGRTLSSSLSAPAPFPHRNRSGESGGGEGARLETGGAKVRKVSGAPVRPRAGGQPRRERRSR